MLYVYILLLLLLILFFIPVKIQLYYEFIDKDEYKITISYLFGLFMREIDSANKDKEIKENNNKRIKKNYFYYVQYFIDKGDIKKLYFRINIGFKDPSLLGVSIGIVWSIINIIFGYFFRNSDIDKIKDIDIQVIPLFEHDIFELFFLCIIKVNLVYIINVYIRILKTKKGGDSIARASNRRINENYNE